MMPDQEVVVDAGAFPDQKEPCPYPGCIAGLDHQGDHQFAPQNGYADEDILGSEGVTPAAPHVPKKARAKRKAPTGLGEVVAELVVHLKQVSVGKAISNVTASLSFDVQVPQDIIELLGEHAYAAVFGGSYLGNGIFLKDVGVSVDTDNHVNQGLKIQLPRYDQGVDQITQYVAPLIPDEEALSPALLALDTGWRLNINVDLDGVLKLHRMQESFDLTKRAE